MTRLEQFEKLLCDVQTNYAEVSTKMDRLKQQDKTKTVTYRELMARKMVLQHMLTMYKAYGLLEDEGGNDR